jgi:hypothetical protein
MAQISNFAELPFKVMDSLTSSDDGDLPVEPKQILEAPEFRHLALYILTQRRWGWSLYVKAVGFDPSYF